MKKNIIFTPRDTNSVKLYMKDLQKCPVFSAEEEKALALRMHQGDMKARDLLFKSNMRYVVTVAKPYIGTCGLDFEDIVEEGNLGLFEACNRFDPEQGRLITFAWAWIKKYIIRAINEKGRCVRVPEHMEALRTRANDFCEEFEQIEERTPSTYEIAEALGVTANQVARLYEGVSTISFNASLSDDKKSGTLGDVYTDMNATTPEDETDIIFTYEMVRKAVAMLPNRERRVISRLFPMDGSSSMSVNEISRELGLTRESIRLIKNKALSILRRNIAA